MKKRQWFLFIFILLILSSFILVSIKKEGGTGEITGATDVSIFVLPAVPVLTIITPENTTYLTIEDLFLSFRETRADSISYNLDNTANTSITSSTYFDASDGQHTLHLYANNNYGTVEKTVTFTVDSSMFRVIYTEYAGSEKGTSTNFNLSSYEDLQDLGGVVLENAGWGKIRFHNSFNTTASSLFSNKILDLDTGTNISLNRIKLNSTALPNFDNPATIWIYNLAFADPRILMDSSVCISSICTDKTYSGGILQFNVTGFTVYSAEETPIEETIIISGGGGGGGSGSGATITTETIVDINPQEFHISLKQGETVNKNLVLENKRNRELEINIQNPFPDLIKISETEFTLGEEEIKVIGFEISADENYVPGIHMGNFIIQNGNVKNNIPILIEVESKNALFDINLKILQKCKYISAGEKICAEVSLYNLGGSGRVDVLMDYMIVDKEGVEILHDSETIAVETSTSFIKSFDLPENLKQEAYVFYVRGAYNGKVASASSMFYIGRAPLPLSKGVLFIIVGVLVIATFIVFIRIRKFKKHLKHPQPKKHKRPKPRSFSRHQRIKRSKPDREKESLKKMIKHIKE